MCACVREAMLNDLAVLFLDGASGLSVYFVFLVLAMPLLLLLCLVLVLMMHLLRLLVAV